MLGGLMALQDASGEREFALPNRETKIEFFEVPSDDHARLNIPNRQVSNRNAPMLLQAMLQEFRNFQPLLIEQSIVHSGAMFVTWSN